MRFKQVQPRCLCFSVLHLISGNKLCLEWTICDKGPVEVHLKLYILRLWLILSLFWHISQTRSRHPSLAKLMGTLGTLLQGGGHHHKIAASGSGANHKMPQNVIMLNSNSNWNISGRRSVLTGYLLK